MFTLFELMVSSFLLQESKFKESGMITAEEFVIAGDYIVYHCPTWSWCVVRLREMAT